MAKKEHKSENTPTKHEWKPTTNYPAVEALIESEAFAPVNEAFGNAYKQLEQISEKKKGLKKGRDAQRAMIGIDRVMTLFKELLGIKYQLKENKEPTKGRK